MLLFYLFAEKNCKKTKKQRNVPTSIRTSFQKMLIWIMGVCVGRNPSWSIILRPIRATKIHGIITIGAKTMANMNASFHKSNSTMVFYFENNWKIIKIATIAIASTKISKITMPIKILEAADGFLASALITAWPKKAMTKDGPMTAINIIPRMINVSASIYFYSPLALLPPGFAFDFLFD